jgi:hypothetical protein
MTVEADVSAHYSGRDLEERILTALREAGKIQSGSIQTISRQWMTSTMADDLRPRHSLLGSICDLICIYSILVRGLADLSPENMAAA